MGDGTATVDAGVLEDVSARQLPQFDRLRGLLVRAEVPAGDDAHLPAVVTRARPPPPRSTPSPCRWAAMAAGGMYDQVGGGFHRYSVDAYWLVPHFEKMLYDQALLLRAYVHGWQVTGEARYRRVAEEIVTYVLRDLRHPEGGFFSAEDADSEGIEGKFYCWSVDELREVCGDDADEVMRFYGVTEQGNFEDPHGIPWQHPPRRAPRRGAAAGRRARPAPAARSAPAGCGQGSTTRSSSAGTHCSSARWRRPRSCSIATTGWPRRAPRVPRHPATQVRRSPAAILAGRPHLLAYAEDHAALLEALLHAGRGRRRRLARPGHAEVAI